MTPQDLDNLLIAWHRWNASDTPPLGYPPECPSCRGFKSSSIWDGYQYGVDRAGVEYRTAPSAWAANVAEVLDGYIKHMEAQQQMALAWLARGLAIRSFAIRNPRLPQGEELDTLVTAAKGELLRMMGEDE